MAISPIDNGEPGSTIRSALNEVIAYVNVVSGSTAFTGSLLGTASYATTSNSASYALTASYALNGGGGAAFPFTGSAEITGSLGVTGSLGQGLDVIASGSFSHAEGYLTIASGSYSHAEGVSTQAIGGGSHAEGQNTQAQGDYSHAEGASVIASGSSSHAEGNSTQAIGDSSHAEGESTQAIGTYSHAEGSTTQAIGIASHAEGQSTISGWKGFNCSISSGTASINDPGDFTLEFNSSGTVITEINIYTYNSMNYDSGLDTTYIYLDDINAVGSYIADTAILNSPLAPVILGNYSHAEGYDTRAMGDFSHAEGNNTQAIGDYSHEGLYTISSGSYQHVLGQYNTHGDDTSLFIIGNGTSTNNRSDILRVTTTDVQVTGSTYITGSLSVTGGIYGYTPVNDNSIISDFSLDTITPGEFRKLDSSAGKITITVPTGSVAGTEYSFWAKDLSSAIDFLAGSGLNLYSEGGKLKINAQFSVVTVKYINSNTAILIGSLKT